MSPVANAFGNLFKRNSVYVTTIFVGAFGFGIGFDVLMTKIFENANKGKLWKDIRDKYVEQ